MNHSKKPIVIIGGGGHASVIASIINKSKVFSCFGYTDLYDRGIICNCKYLGQDEEIINDIENNYSLAIGISYVNNVFDKIRIELINKLLKINHFDFPVIISSSADVDDNVNLGKGTVVINGATINTGVQIGDFCVINSSATIDHNSKLGKNVQVGPSATICGDVEIGSNVFVGAGATIIDSVKICDDVVIAAGSLVVKSIEKPGLYKGVPCRFVDK